MSTMITSCSRKQGTTFILQRAIQTSQFLIASSQTRLRLLTSLNKSTSTAIIIHKNLCFCQRHCSCRTFSTTTTTTTSRNNDNVQCKEPLTITGSSGNSDQKQQQQQQQQQQSRHYSSSPSTTAIDEDEEVYTDIVVDDDANCDDNDDKKQTSLPKARNNGKNEYKRIWLASSDNEQEEIPLYWSSSVKDAKHDSPDQDNLSSLLERIEKQELQGGRMRAMQYGVLNEDPVVDMRLLIQNYTAPSLASALRDREEVLQLCAQLAAEENWKALQATLHPFHPSLLMERRNQVRRLDLRKPLNATSLEIIRKALMRMPRRVTQAHSRRAGVVIPICHVDGVPSLLLEKRAAHLRAHPDEVCLPGGMVCSVADKTIVETCLREMKEEIGGLDFDHHHHDDKSTTTATTTNNDNSHENRTNNNNNGSNYGISVLGVLRCNWGDVHHLVGVAVTPVVCALSKDLNEVDLKPNPDEVAEVFTIPLAALLDSSSWIYKEDHAPIFVGGPYVIWGLTGYILERFRKDILLPFNVETLTRDPS